MVSEYEYPTDIRALEFYGTTYTVTGNQPLLPAMEVPLGEKVVYTRTINSTPPVVESTNEAVTRKKSWVFIRNQSHPATNRVYPLISKGPTVGAMVRFMFTNSNSPVDLHLVDSVTKEILVTLARGFGVIQAQGARFFELTAFLPRTAPSNWRLSTRLPLP